MAERRRLRILLIEDNPGDVELIRATFEEARDRDVVLATAERVSTALERLNREEFDAVLLDLGLPDSYGLESLRRIHENATSVPIIVLTGLDYEEMAASALLSGAQDYLIKGQIDSDLLLRSIR
ncbi:MAG TPA: response regulator, partial [Thermodesulfovibrionales bacterium]|nr:response regulator [Thermodesulfovibrionales bacterium]